jgi:hypothetical protein
MTGPPAVVLHVCSQASKLAAVPGQLRVGSPSARCLARRAARSQPCAARQSVLNAPRPAAWRAEHRNISPSPHWRFCGIFFIGPRGLSVRVLRCARALATIPVPVPRSVVPCNSVLVRSGRTLGWTGSLIPRVTESCCLHC